MLIIRAEIMLYNPSENSPKNDGICARNILRPAFNFGEGLLFSGTIGSDNIRDKYYYENIYVVKVEFPTIENEAYEAVQPLIKIGMNLDIQNASRIIGKAKLIDYTYKD